MRKVVVPIAILLAVTAGVVDWGRRPAARAAPRYRCQDLGSLGGRVAEAAGLNNLGHVVGASRVTGDTAVHAFLHDGERMIDLGRQPGWANSQAHGIDDEGRVVGGAMVRSSSGECQTGFLLDSISGRLRDLGWPAQTVVPGVRSTFLPITSTAYAPGSAGEVVGMARFPNEGQYPRACLWDDAGITDLGTLGGGSSAARAINRAGWVVGEAQTSSGDQHAFLWISGTMHDLETLGGWCSAAQDVNDRGEVVGGAAADSGGDHAFVWRRGRMRDLGVLPGGRYSIAHATNNDGQIVGSSDVGWRQGSREPIARSLDRMPPLDPPPAVWERAVLWRQGELYDLNRLCGAPGVLLLSARAINERGQIAANGLTPEGEIRPILLTPIEAGIPRPPAGDRQRSAGRVAGKDPHLEAALRPGRAPQPGVQRVQVGCREGCLDLRGERPEPALQHHRQRLPPAQCGRAGRRRRARGSPPLPPLRHLSGPPPRLKRPPAGVVHGLVHAFSSHSCTFPCTPPADTPHRDAVNPSRSGDREPGITA